METTCDMSISCFLLIITTSSW